MYEYSLQKTFQIQLSFETALKIPFIDKLLSEEGYNFAHAEIIGRHEMEP